MESIRNDEHPLRRELAEMTSPLAKLLLGMSQDRSLERIDDALNAIGEPWGNFDMVGNDADAAAIFGKLRELTNIDEPQEAAKKAREICAEIEALS